MPTFVASSLNDFADAQEIITMTIRNTAAQNPVEGSPLIVTAPVAPLTFPASPIQVQNVIENITASATETLPSPNQTRVCEITIFNGATAGSGFLLTVAPPASTTIVGPNSNVLAGQESQTYVNDTTTTWRQK